ncbi:hypothetical protein [Phenylobacterium sp.]|uniref:hypothetical protein n=1 Tax=Phenylobacterium sp. TaxID=1871053 RepID=UPI002DF3E313|nr:hypothetical protein [Phenylobacterium sp.]
MVRRNYVGMRDPVARFEELEPLVDKLRALRLTCKPFGRDYHALSIALEAMDSTAYHFTRRPHFYAGKPHG